IVRSAEQPDAFYGGPAAARDLDDMVVFEELVLRTALPCVADEGAPAAIAFPDLSLDVGRDMPRVGAPLRSGSAAAGRQLRTWRARVSRAMRRNALSRTWPTSPEGSEWPRRS